MTARTDGPDAARATRPATPVRSGGPARRSGLVRRHGPTRSGGVPPERAVRPVLGDDERGSGTALSASIIVVLCVTAFWVLVLSGWIASDQRARQAADLAALAGAHARAPRILRQGALALTDLERVAGVDLFERTADATQDRTEVGA